MSFWSFFLKTRFSGQHFLGINRRPDAAFVECSSVGRAEPSHKPQVQHMFVLRAGTNIGKGVMDARTRPKNKSFITALAQSDHPKPQHLQAMEVCARPSSQQHRRSTHECIAQMASGIEDQQHSMFDSSPAASFG